MWSLPALAYYDFIESTLLMMKRALKPEVSMDFLCHSVVAIEEQRIRSLWLDTSLSSSQELNLANSFYLQSGYH